MLLHITSLPGPYGIGDLGPGARSFLEWLDAAEQRVWQVLPLNPVDAMGCPYASDSAMAREPLLLSMDDLADAGWLASDDKPWVGGDPNRVDWPAITAARWPVLQRVADRVRDTVDVEAFAARQPRLATYALYRALTEVHGPDWRVWPEALRHRDRAATDAFHDAHPAGVQRHLALQLLFERQWSALRTEASRRGIALWGDLPIFVDVRSCDVWASPELWRLDAQGQPEVVSGVPPDGFSPTGQLWGHPLYALAAHRDSDHRWWIDRVRAATELFDRVRIDHFRGLAAMWTSPGDAEDATAGQWTPGLGAPLLEALQACAAPAEPSGELPLFAEDLGIITPDVQSLRDRFGLQGMTVLQFAWAAEEGAEWSDHPYLPHNHRRDQVCYVGTHDNDTALGWYRGTDDASRDRLRRYLQVDDRELPWALLVAAWRSVADTAIVPMQDLLALGGDARMNRPGTITDNWAWRVSHEALNLPLAARIADQTRLSGRGGAQGASLAE